jgi:RNA polymerase sigma-70 factor (ECF subfamily)
MVRVDLDLIYTRDLRRSRSWGQMEMLATSYRPLPWYLFLLFQLRVTASAAAHSLPMDPVIAFKALMDAPIDAATLLGELGVGNDKAAADLVVLLYSELRSLASHYLRRERSGHTLQTTALVHEAYLRLADQREIRWKNREQFMGVAAQLMRRILVDYSRGHDAKKRGKGYEKVLLEEASEFSKGKASDVIALDEALTRLAEFDPQQARLVEMRFFGGLSIEESAAVLGVSRTTVKRNWNLAKAWLARELRRGEANDA